MKYSLFFLTFFFTITIFAQREDHRWYFGDSNKGFFFDYNTNNLTQTTEHQPLIYAGAYFVANDPISGQLLFYTDGTKIYDRNHQTMPNGTGLTNGIHTIQTGLCCYYPGHANQYLMFCNTSTTPNSGSVYYNVIDLSLPGNGTTINPRGNVVSGMKNIYLTNQSTEGMMIIPGVCDTYWLIVPALGTNLVKIFKIDNTGVSLNETKNIGFTIGECCQVRYSPVSEKIGIAVIPEILPSLVMDFNKTNGAISNVYAIPGLTGTSSTGGGICDLEWSPSGNKLYISKYRIGTNTAAGQLLQFDITTPSVSPVLIANVGSSYSYVSKGLKLAPNGKIYHFYGITTNTYIGAISNPDASGTACNYSATAINMVVGLGQIHKFPEFLSPLEENFSVSSSDTTTDFVCRPNDTTHISIPIENIVSNPCGSLLTYQILSVSYGTAHVIGENIQYVQPNFYTTNDTIVFVACTGSGQCDTSQMVVHFNYVGPVTPFITCVNDTLYSSSSANNQWLFNGTPIAGATNDFYVPTLSGYYSVKINVGLCYGESAPVFYEPSGVADNKQLKLNVFPNPGKNILTISGFNNDLISVFDINGKKILEIKNNGKIDISNLVKGTYLLKVIKEGKPYSTIFIKE